jgi:hypothetical protein
MQTGRDSEKPEKEELGPKARRAGVRHLLLGFLALLAILFLISWCSLPVR